MAVRTPFGFRADCVPMEKQQKHTRNDFVVFDFVPQKKGKHYEHW